MPLSQALELALYGDLKKFCRTHRSEIMKPGWHPIKQIMKPGWHPIKQIIKPGWHPHPHPHHIVWLMGLFQLSSVFFHNTVKDCTCCKGDAVMRNDNNNNILTTIITSVIFNIVIILIKIA